MDKKKRERLARIRRVRFYCSEPEGGVTVVVAPPFPRLSHFDANLFVLTRGYV